MTKTGIRVRQPMIQQIPFNTPEGKVLKEAIARQLGFPTHGFVMLEMDFAELERRILGRLDGNPPERG